MISEFNDNGLCITTGLYVFVCVRVCARARACVCVYLFSSTLNASPD